MKHNYSKMCPVTKIYKDVLHLIMQITMYHLVYKVLHGSQGDPIAISGQSEQQVPLELFKPSHLIIPMQNSLASNCRLRSTEGRAKIQEELKSRGEGLYLHGY